MQSTEISFCICLWSNNKNVITCLYFSRALIRWKSTHCHLIYLMELFQGKESSKEKVDLNNNSETHDQIIIRIIIRISKKNVEFCGGKHLSFYPKGVCSFSVFFYLNEEELGQQVCLIKYVDNETSYSSIPLAKKKEKGRERERERERGKNTVQLQKHF